MRSETSTIFMFESRWMRELRGGQHRYDDWQANRPSL